MKNNLTSNENKRVSVSVRLENSSLDKYKEIANLLNVSTSDILRDVLNEYITKRTAYNIYLDTIEAFYITLPKNILIKNEVINKSFNLNEDLNTLITEYEYKTKDFIKDLYDPAIYDKEIPFTTDIDKYEQETVIKYNNPDLYTAEGYKILRVPNNLDKFNRNLKTYCYQSLENHRGLEFFIIPDLANYTENYLECLYCLLFTVENETKVKINLINLQEAFHLVSKTDNIYLSQLIENIYRSLKNANNIEDVTKIANVYNSQNIREIKKEPIEPIKLMETQDSKVKVEYHDKQLLNKINNLEKENRRIKKENSQIKDNIRIEAQKAVDDLLKEYLN